MGPVRAATGAAIAALPAKERIVLATLLLRNGQVVATSALIEALWDDKPPPTARNSVQGHIKQLRRLLGPTGRRIITKAPGYLIEVRPGELDLDSFTRLTGRARSAAKAGDWEDAATLLNEALALWRGEPLSDTPSLLLQRNETPRLSELRAQALDARIDADLRSGKHDEATAELRQLVAAHPHRERSWAQLMLALYRGGRPGEALAAYQEARRILREELGVDPGRQLQVLHHRILTADSALTDDRTGSWPPAEWAGSRAGSQAAARPDAAGGHGLGDVPAQLPADTTDFTGRAVQVELLCGLLAAEPAEGRAGAVVISAVAGMGGIGKTALTVHAAHRLRDRYPDGQLFACLQGATCALRPAEVLARFLRDLGVPDAAIPAGEAERAARYRTLLAGRRMLIVLDDARDAAQVRPLLPGTAGCAVLVTSRSTLPGLPGAALLSLEALDQSEAGDLFGAIIGAGRAAAEPDATAAVLACCAGLPLAVRITASRLASRPHWSIAHLAARLAVEQNRLAELATGDLAVRASFAVSYDALPAGRPDPARVFRLLGLADLAVISLPAVAALAGRPAGEVAAALEILTDACLLESPAADRFRLHDLLRGYAAELAGHTDTAADRNTALHRMLGWYGEQAVTAARILAPGRLLPATVAVQAAAAAPAMAGPAQALDWYEAERAGLLAAARRAAGLGRHDIAAQIAVAMWDFFQRTPHADDWLAVSQTGVASARHLGDDAVLSWLLNGLGQVHGQQRRFADSRRCLSEALEIRQRAGDRHGEAAVLNSLACDLFYQDRFEDALEYLRVALAIHAALGEQPDIAIILNNTGHALLCLKRHDEALDHLGQALALQQETGRRHAEGITQTTIAHVNLELGRFEAAVEHYRQAQAALDESAREHLDQADILCGLGAALAALGRAGEAREAWLAAIPILDGAGDPRAAELSARLTAPGAAPPPATG